MPSFEFTCKDCNVEFVIGDIQDKLDVSSVLCVDCAGRNVELTAFSQWDDDGTLLELSRRIAELEERVIGLERALDEDDPPEFEKDN